MISMKTCGQRGKSAGKTTTLTHVQWKARENKTSVTGEKSGPRKARDVTSAGKATPRDRWKGRQIQQQRETHSTGGFDWPKRTSLLLVFSVTPFKMD